MAFNQSIERLRRITERCDEMEAQHKMQQGGQVPKRTEPKVSALRSGLLSGMGLAPKFFPDDPYSRKAHEATLHDITESLINRGLPPQLAGTIADLGGGLNEVSGGLMNILTSAGQAAIGKAGPALRGLAPVGTSGYDIGDIAANIRGVERAISEAQKTGRGITLEERLSKVGGSTGGKSGMQPSFIRGHEGGKVPLAPPMLKQLAEAASTKHGVPVDLILAIIQAESSGRPGAFNPEKGGNPSTGLMQLRFTTAQGLGYKGKQEGLYDPEVNVDLGAKYLAQQMKRYKGDLASTISSYNAGTAKRNKAGAFLNQKYVDRVQGYMKPPAPITQGLLAPDPTVGLPPRG